MAVDSKPDGNLTPVMNPTSSKKSPATPSRAVTVPGVRGVDAMSPAEVEQKVVSESTNVLGKSTFSHLSATPTRAPTTVPGPTGRLARFRAALEV